MLNINMHAATHTVMHSNDVYISVKSLKMRLGNCDHQ